MRPKRIVVAVVTALLAFGIPGIALAETRVVLENESSGSEVHTGEATFTNNSNDSVMSSTFDPPGAGSTQQGLTTTAPQTVGTAQTFAPSTAATTETLETEVQSVEKAGDQVANSSVAGATPAFTII